ncbi:dienelactone hydrolase family protein [Streptomyces sp. SID11385]|uniref:alpha/beta hydrolase family protein n=1 Tax=Streptomyces sp. SID11385 TaxID=2706031 RepID=UPI0013C58D58|nr:dienelactone hydrolase family protein [Streptomyces sp. SID11385]NEA43776.1 chlorophyllase [Streptomyces sp. SID11385]
MPHASPSPVVSVKPLTLPAPGRGTELRLRVAAPATGERLPVVLFAHGFGSSLEGYGPLADHWAARGFVVIQPTHLDSKALGLAADDPRRPRFWRHRVEDMKRVLDDLGALVAHVPGLAERVDTGRIAAAGHSFGGQTAGVLLGLRVTDPETGTAQDLSDARVSAGVLIATAGSGGADLTPFATTHLPWLRGQDFSALRRPALVVAGDADDLPLSVRGAEWTQDPYTLSPGPKSLLTVHGGEHSLGGIPGYGSAETTDENPARLALVQDVTTAYLHDVLGTDGTAWSRARAELAGGAHPLGRLESK